MDLSLCHGTDEWKNARYDNITCTDLGKILGMDQTCSRKKLLVSKWERRDLLENASDFTKALINKGKEFEASAMADYKLWRLRSGYTENAGFVPSMHQDEEAPGITGSPDMLIPGARTVVEFKTHWFPDVESAQPFTIDRIPAKYYLQVQGYLQIMKYQTGHLFSWTLNNGYRVFEIDRDISLWERAIKPPCITFKLWMEAAGGANKRVTKVILADARVSADEKAFLSEAVSTSIASCCREITHFGSLTPHSPDDTRAM